MFRKTITVAVSALALVAGMVYLMWIDQPLQRTNDPLEIDNNEKYKTLANASQGREADDSTGVTSQVESTRNPTAHIIEGFLIDNHNQAVPVGDIMVAVRKSKFGQECEGIEDLQVELNNETQLIRSDSTGHFDLSVADQFFDGKECLILHASKPGYVTTMVAMGAEALTTRIEIELQKHVQLLGLVQTPLGQAQAQASIIYWRAVENYALDKKPQPCEFSDHNSIEKINSNDLGEFSLQLSTASGICLQAQHENWASSEIVLVEANTSEKLTLTLQTPLAFSGTVMDLGGLPIPGLSLQLKTMDENKSHVGYEAQTNSAGEFIFTSLDSGNFALLSNNPRYAIAKPDNVTLSADKPLIEVNVSVFPLTIIRGQLTDNYGDPVADVQVTARSPYIPELSTTRTTSGKDGRFELPSAHQSKVVRDMLAMTKEFSEENIPQSNSTESATFCLNFYHPNQSAPELELYSLDSQLELGQIIMTNAPTLIRGQVVNHRGEGVKAQLQFQWLGAAKSGYSDPPTSCVQSTTALRVNADEHGEFIVNVEKMGAYEVKVITEVYRERVMNVIVESGSRIELQIK